MDTQFLYFCKDFWSQEKPFCFLLLQILSNIVHLFVSQLHNLFESTYQTSYCPKITALRILLHHTSQWQVENILGAWDFQLSFQSFRIISDILLVRYNVAYLTYLFLLNFDRISQKNHGKRSITRIPSQKPRKPA